MFLTHPTSPSSILSPMSVEVERCVILLPLFLFLLLLLLLPLLIPFSLFSQSGNAPTFTSLAEGSDSDELSVALWTIGASSASLGNLPLLLPLSF